MIHRERRRLRWALLAAALCAGPAGRAAATQYDMVTDFDLSPYVTGGEAFGVYRSQVVGLSPLTITTAGAVLWTSPSQRITLNPGPGVSSNYPLGYQTSTAYAIYGNQEVGKGISNVDGQQHALLWTGTAPSVVDLSAGPAGIGYATATDGAQQVGVVSGGFGGDAALWSGTAASFINLNPSGYDQSYALGVCGGMQVGYGNPHGGPIGALVWHGSANNYTVLGTQAEALGISRGQIVGFSDKLPRTGSYRDAVIWTGPTAASFTDAAPPNTTASKLQSTNGTQQVGDYSVGASVLGQLPLDHHAAVWAGTAASFQPLPMPAGDNYSTAFSIDGDGNIAGIAGTDSTSGIVPVMWVPHRLPGDANFDGVVNFADLLILAQHYGQPGEWVDGEFSGGGTVDFGDLLTLAQNYGRAQSADQVYSVEPATGGTVPEPGGLVLIAGATSAAWRRRAGSIAE